MIGALRDICLVPNRRNLHVAVDMLDMGKHASCPNSIFHMVVGDRCVTQDSAASAGSLLWYGMCSACSDHDALILWWSGAFLITVIIHAYVNIAKTW